MGGLSSLSSADWRQYTRHRQQTQDKQHTRSTTDPREVSVDSSYVGTLTTDDRSMQPWRGLHHTWLYAVCLHHRVDNNIGSDSVSEIFSCYAHTLAELWNIWTTAFPLLSASVSRFKSCTSTAPSPKVHPHQALKMFVPILTKNSSHHRQYRCWYILNKSLHRQ